jgi:WD40 repeat protein/serine/threonine protein kinase/tetratricopeptide (TPR) repeat protein
MATDKSEQFVLLSQLADEFADRYRRGERPSLQEYTDRHPGLADDILELFPALVEMEQAKEDRDNVSEPENAGPLPPLERLGDFRIIREIGHGGMGVVYEAEQISLGRRVALKVLPRQVLADAKAKRRFEREARAAAKLHHTNIVPVFGVGEHEGLLYYAMQFIQGLGLDVVLDELRRVRQPLGRPVPTQGGAVGRKTDINMNVTAADVAKSLLTGNLQPVDPATALTIARESQQASNLGVDMPARAASSSATIHLPGQSDASTLTESGRQYWQSVARIGMQVADALAHAASQGVLHRDIKPANLLLDDTGNVWVTDFGLAKGLTDGDNLTHTGDIVGTMRYMAPERFNGQGDVRSDTYALGLTLYELLTLRPAFSEADRNKLIKQVMHDEPLRPRKLNPGVPRDLETVVLKAIARDPAHRYQTPAAMAEDLKRFVEDRPIRARRVSDVERLWRWCRRNPLPASLLGVIVLVFLAGFVAVSWQWRAAEVARTDEVSHRKQAELAREQAETTLYFSNIARAQLEYRANHVAESEAILNRCPEARRGWEWSYLKRLCHGDLRTLPGVGQARHTSWVYAVAHSPDGKLLASSGGGNPFWATPTAGGPRPGEVILWDIATGTSTNVLRGHANLVTAVAFSPDGQLLASASPHDSARVWEVGSGRLLRILPESWCVAFSPDGKFLATATSSRTIQVWNLATDPSVDPVPQSTFSLGGGGTEGIGLSFSPDGRRLACAIRKDALHGEVVVLNFPEGSEALTLQSNTGPVNGVHYSPDGRHLAADLGAKNTAGFIRLWDPATGRLVQSLVGHRGEIHGIVFDPTGERLASAGADGTVRVWTVPQGQETRLYRGHLAGAMAVAFSTDGMRLTSASADGSIKIWDLTQNPETAEVLTLNPEDAEEMRGLPLAELEAMVFVGAGQQIITAQRGGRIRVLDCDTHVQVGSVRQVPLTRRWMTPAETAAFDPDGRWLAGISEDDPKIARCWDARTGAERVTFRGHTQELQLVTINGSGRVATAGRPARSEPLRSEIKVWDGVSGQPIMEVDELNLLAERLAFSPTGDSLAVSGRELMPPAGDGRPRAQAFVRVYDINTRDIIHSFSGGNEPFMALAFSPDGGRLAAAGYNRTVLLWDLATAHPNFTLQGPEGAMDLAFSPDGRRVAVASRQAIKLLDVASGEEVLILRGVAHLNPDTNGFNPRVRFSPDGRRIAAVCHDYFAPLSIWSVEEVGSNGAGRPLAANRRALAVHFSEAISSSLDPTRRATFLFHLKWLEGAELITAADHAMRGMLFAREGRWDRATADFGQATKLDPGDPAIWFECGAGLAAAGRWDQAIPYFARFADLDCLSSIQWRGVTALPLYLNDMETYRRNCRKMLDLFGRSEDLGVVRDLLSWGLLMGDAGVGAEVYLSLADRCLVGAEKHSEYGSMLQARGMAEFRAGQMEQALEWLLKASSLLNSRQHERVVNDFLLSMGYQRLNQPTEAKAAYQHGLQLMKQIFGGVDQYQSGNGRWFAWLRCQIFRRQAEKLLSE